MATAELAIGPVLICLRQRPASRRGTWNLEDIHTLLRTVPYINMLNDAVPLVVQTARQPRRNLSPGPSPSETDSASGTSGFSPLLNTTGSLLEGFNESSRVHVIRNLLLTELMSVLVRQTPSDPVKPRVHTLRRQLFEVKHPEIAKWIHNQSKPFTSVIGVRNGRPVKITRGPIVDPAS